MKLFKQKYPKIDLTVEDIHASEILHPDTFPDKRNKEKYESIPFQIREEFIESFFEIVNKNVHNYFVISDIKEPQVFVKKKEQAKYGECLVCLFGVLANSINNKDEVDFFISCRSRKFIKEEKEWKEYHNEIGNFLEKFLSERNIKSYYNPNNKPEINLSLKLADIVCYYFSNYKDKLKNKIIKQNKKQASIDIYKKFEEKHLEKLISNEEFSAAYRLNKNKDYISKIKSIKEKEKQKSQFEYFLNIADDMIETRSDLGESYEIVTKIHEAVKENSKLIDINKKALNGMLKIFNHKGEFGKIYDITEQFKKDLNQQGNIPLLNKLTELIDFKNRALNDQFNSYHFDKVIDKFESELEKYEKIITWIQQETNLIEANEKDYLLHKGFSSIGQAYAFLSSTEKDYFEAAEKYFEKSMQHWDEKDTRTINYMITFYWYHDKFEKSIEILKKYRQDLYVNDSLTNTIKELKKKIKPFDFLTLLRLIYEQESLEPNFLKNLIQLANQYQSSAYPLNMVYKWIGFCSFKKQNYQQALDCFEKSIKMTQESKEGFTVKTLSLPCEALKIICKQKLKPEENYEKDYEYFQQVQQGFCAESVGFKEYIKYQNLIEDIQQKNIEKISRWLPFHYS